MFSKANDYLLQTSPISVWYLSKAVEGNVINSVSAFIGVATLIPYVKRDSSPRKSPQYKQHQEIVFHVFRTPAPWLTPDIGDRIYALGTFWNVEEVEFTDYDDSQLPQRYRLTCAKTAQTVLP